MWSSPGLPCLPGLRQPTGFGRHHVERGLRWSGLNATRTSSLSTKTWCASCSKPSSRSGQSSRWPRSSHQGRTTPSPARPSNGGAAPGRRVRHRADGQRGQVAALPGPPGASRAPGARGHRQARPGLPVGLVRRALDRGRAGFTGEHKASTRRQRPGSVRQVPPGL
jgi:hypothetical protein